MTTHASLSPSAAKRWMACPGSIRLSEGIPRKSSVYADEGSAAHYLAEYILRHTEAGGKPQSAAAFIGKVVVLGKEPDIKAPDNVKKGANAHRITEEMAEAVDVYTELVCSLPGIRLIEQRVSASAYYDGIFGTSDAIVVDAFDTMYVVDYKHGAGVPVEAADNPQAMIYALGALDAFDADCERVEVIIVQPRAPHAEGPVRRWGIAAEELRQWGRDILAPAARRTEAKDAPIMAGDHCRFCPAQAKCPTVAQKALEVAQQEFLPTSIPQTMTLPSPELMTDEQISKVLLFAQTILTPWVKEVEGYVQGRLESGHKLDDWKLVRKRATRKWGDERQAEAAFSTILKQEMYDISLKSPAQMEKALKAAGADPALVVPLLAQTDPGLTLAHVTDKRPAVQPLPPVAEFLDDDPAFD